MKVGIVLDPYREKKPSGLGRAAFEITNALVEQGGADYVVFTKGNRGIPQLKGMFEHRGIAKSILALDHMVWKHRDIDVFVFLTPRVPLFLKPQKSVVVAHDFYHFVTTTSYKSVVARLFSRRAVRVADHVVCVSSATRNDLHALFPKPEHQTSVIYNGYTNFCNKKVSAVHGPEPYFMTAGVVKERKNTKRIIEAFAEFSKDHPEYHFVVSGKYHENDSYFLQIKNFLNQNDLESRVHFIGFVSDEKLGGLFSKTRGFIYATLYEGFGMAMLEAMSCGAPVVSSNLEAHVEAVGNAALLVEPESVEEIAAAMELLVNEKHFSQYVQKSKEQSELFSWDRAGAQYFDAIKNVYGS